MVLFVLLFGFLLISSLPWGGTVSWCLGVAGSTALMWMRTPRLSMPRPLATLLLYPFLLLVVNLHGIYDHPAADFFKDCWYFTLPLVYLSVGYLTMDRVRSWSRLMQPALLAGFGLGLASLVHAVLNRGELAVASSVDAYRAVTGTGTFVPMAPLVLILMARRAGLPMQGLERWKSFRVAVYFVSTAAILVTFSRTHILMLLAGVLVAVRLRSAVRRFLFSGAGVVVLAVLIGAGVYFSSRAQSGPLELFVTKVLNSGSEVQVRAYETFEQINNNWRGYEAYRASRTFATYSLPEKIFGGGGGSMVDLGFAMQLSATEFFKYVPITHNGYMYLLVKDGVMGIVLFALFVLQLAWTGRKALRMRDPEARMAGLLLLWTPLVIAATQGVITGIFNKGELIPILFLAGAATASYHQRRRLLEAAVERAYLPGAGRRALALQPSLAARSTAL